jgi:hypothetical protein
MRFFAVLLLSLSMLGYTGPVVSASAQSALAVKAVTVNPSRIRSWVYSQGTVRSTQREYMMLETAGKVAWIRCDGAGNSLREGAYGQRW